MNKTSCNFANILSAKFKIMRKKEYLAEVSKRIINKKPTMIFTPNTQILLSANKCKKESELLRKADILIPDGSGVYLASKMLGTPFPERMGGIDFAESLLSFAEKNQLSVFLLGGKPDIANQAANKLQMHYPKLCICGTHHGYFNKRGAENDAVIKKIKDASPDILFVCFGYPLQECWLSENISALPSVLVCAGLGGSLDVWSENIRRAPRFLQACGFEWLWRVVKEPRRATVFLDIPHFIFLVTKQKFIGSS